MKWTPTDIAALIIIVGCFALLATGIDGEVKALLTVAGGWAFGRGYQTIRNYKP